MSKMTYRTWMTTINCQTSISTATLKRKQQCNKRWLISNSTIVSKAQGERLETNTAQITWQCLTSTVGITTWGRRLEETMMERLLSSLQLQSTKEWLQTPQDRSWIKRTNGPVSSMVKRIWPLRVILFRKDVTINKTKMSDRLSLS